jgi:hypothetical protein
MMDDPAAQIGRQIALAGLALSQAAYLIDEQEPIELSELRHHLAQRKVLTLLSDAAHLAALFETRTERTTGQSVGNGLRVVRDAGVPVESSGHGREPGMDRKPVAADVDREELTWECSRLSAPHGLEVAELSGGSVALRDADDPAGPVLIASRWEWESFVASITTGAFVRLR